MPDRPAEIAGFQPQGPQLGTPGPDQGFALHIAKRLLPTLVLQGGEHPDDVVIGCLGVALRRASLFSRAPVVYDLKCAFTMWGYDDEQPDPDLLALRKRLFEGLRHVGHHYAEGRTIADMVPVETLQMTPAEVVTAHGADWRHVLGV